MLYARGGELFIPAKDLLDIYNIIRGPYKIINLRFIGF